MLIGPLRHRITIESPTRAKNAVGETVITWTAIENAERWASVRPLTTSELMRAGQPVADVVHLIRMRYTADVQPDRRIRWNDRIFNIVGVKNIDELNAVLEITANEVVKP